MSKRVIVFSGHRDVQSGDHGKIRHAIIHALREADEIVLGGAIGADWFALDEAWNRKAEARAIDPESKTALCDIVVIVAGTIADQPQEAKEQLLWHRNNGTAVKIIELGLPYIGKNLIHRNHVMLDRAAKPNSGRLILYWSGHKKGGTWSALCYGRKLGLEIENVGEGDINADVKKQGSFNF